jgi:dihydroorotate dehydrogenase (NAD+) catalytic subunit
VPIARQDLSLSSPWLNAAGMQGFRPPREWGWPAPQGAFVTNPLSLTRRTPAEARACQPYPGGFLLHTGLPNPGLREVLRHQARRWEHSALPVWLHLMADSPETVARMVAMLEGLESVAALELGFAPETAPKDCLALVEAASGDLPVIAALPLTAAGEPWLKDFAAAGASAISLGAPRGALPRAGGGTVSGRLYGPGLFPLALAAVGAAKDCGLPVIAGAGVYRLQEGQALLSAGAWAVQLDAVLWGTGRG